MSTALEQWTAFAPRPEPLGPGQEWHVFLSYRSVNRAWVINLYDVLRAHGHRVFLDQVTLAAGDPLVRRLESGLEKSRAGVLVWSTRTEDSEWVRREYEVMEIRTDDDFHFVPVRLDAANLPAFARRRVFLDFSQYPDGPNGGELLRLLHAITGRPLSDEAAHFAAEQDELARGFIARINAAVANGSKDRLSELFDNGGAAWETSSALGCAVAEGLTKLGDNEGALEVLDVLTAKFPRAIRPRQLRALALARRGNDGDLDDAQEILGTLYEAGERDPETLGIYGRTWMDRYNQSGSILHLRRSRDLYAEAFDGAQDDYYTGVNAAAKSVFLGTAADIAQARDIAGRVQKIVGDAPVRGDYWKTATVAELQLVLGDWDGAAKNYLAAVTMAPTEEGSHRSTWKQACRLMANLEPTDAQRAGIRAAFAHLPECE